MKLIILVVGFWLIVNNSYSQKEQGILNSVLQSFKKELPKMEKQSFRQLRNQNKSNALVKNGKYPDYYFIVLPMFKLKDEYYQY